MRMGAINLLPGRPMTAAINGHMLCGGHQQQELDHASLADVRNRL